MNSTFHLIPTQNFSKLADAISKLTRKAEKLNCGILKMIEIDTVIFPEKNQGMSDRIFKMVKILGDAPILNGWQFAGIVETTLLELDNGQTEIKGIIQSLPNFSIPREFEKKFGLCDHCQTNRNRNQVYVVQHVDSKEFKLVGGTCLKDFTGHANPHAVASFAEYVLSAISEADGAQDDGFYGNGNANTWSKKHILNLATALILNCGFTSKGKAEETGREASANTLAAFLFSLPESQTYKNLKAYFEATEQVFEISEQTETWAKTLGDSDNDYLYKLSLYARKPVYTAKDFGMVCAMVFSYLREVEKLREAKNTLPSEYMGTIGEKLTFSAEFVGKTAIDGQYGTTYCVRFKTSEGNRLTWFASNPDDMEVGQTVTMIGTVKDHNEYKNVKSTIVTRCKPYIEKPAKAKRASKKDLALA